MAGRPRTITDEQLLAAVGSAVRAIGPIKLTMADVARTAGVSTGALVQRYGSKRGMLLAFLKAGSVGPGMRAAFEAAADPVDGIQAALAYGMAADQSPDEFANSLAFLHLDLSDPEFREVLAGYQESQLADLRSYLVIAGVERAGLAEVLTALRHGTQIAWAISRDGVLLDALRANVETVLAPYRKKK
ncbi:TetR/AcrR family transcriptional regulator [Fodinicola feengrottensis]|uniref:TetR/AcrR family transcriptional regulator n=1 Tax=Fodinicola feengrottensis TaxID=435914 RepID=A0ABN2H114_9ACTN